MGVYTCPSTAVATVQSLIVEGIHFICGFTHAWMDRNDHPVDETKPRFALHSVRLNKLPHRRKSTSKFTTTRVPPKPTVVRGSVRGAQDGVQHRRPGPAGGGLHEAGGRALLAFQLHPDRQPGDRPAAGEDGRAGGRCPLSTWGQRHSTYLTQR